MRPCNEQSWDWHAGGVSGVSKISTFAFLDTIVLMSNSCMMVVLIELYTVILLSVSLTSFQGHSNIRRRLSFKVVYFVEFVFDLVQTLFRSLKQ